jgi:exodeoxyribonuclease V alpha subunit
MEDDSTYPSFMKDESNPIEADVVIIDEVSMVDIILMNCLLKAISPGTRLILVGDQDQLPSVGAGNVLRDIIESQVVKVITLDEIFRQAKESMIVVNAHKINKGEYPVLNQKDKDFFFIGKTKPELALETIIELCNERLPKYNGYHPLKDIQIITPMRKGVTGVTNINQAIQSVLNPAHPSKEEKKYRETIFRVGDKVMQIKNNYNISWQRTQRQGGDSIGQGVFNGDVGFIQSIDQEDQIVTVLFDDEKMVNYEFNQLDELELAYGVTVHKSQGSEFPVVIMSVNWGPPMLLTRNLLYTAVTRAKGLVVLVGSEEYLRAMVNNNYITKRYSGLGHKLRSALHSVTQ